MTPPDPLPAGLERCRWPAPGTVRAFTTDRLGGSSEPPFDSFNLATHVGDETARVAENRRRFEGVLGLEGTPAWLNQVHGHRVVRAERVMSDTEADGSVTSEPGTACVILTADCLPVLLCDLKGSRVAALHAGWRGLLSGILEAGVDAMERPSGAIMAWLGPAIGPTAFEVGDEVLTAFSSHDARSRAAFSPLGNGRWNADIFRLARLRLGAAGVTRIYGEERCTFREAQRYYSYRRERRTGRMASVIWISRV